MINVIYGGKGSGKTKKIIDKANVKAANGKGLCVYITDSAEHSSNLNSAVRFVDIRDYTVTDEDSLVAFIEGLLAGNYDITDIYIDGPTKFLGMDISVAQNLYQKLEEISMKHSTSFTCTVSAEELPEFMYRYI